MHRSTGKLFLAAIFLYSSFNASAQLVVTPVITPQALAQMLVGNGVTISNVSFTGNLQMAGFFNNKGRNDILIDSGIILTSGRAKTQGNSKGVDGDGAATAISVLANTGWNLPGDPDLSIEISNPNTRDACVLEFDFIPLGDSIKFNYVFSSEEYTPAFVCSFNDAFAFFISGPGIPGLKNIALVPRTAVPVSIFNVNDVPGGACPNNMAYYIDNRFNRYVTHDGHTTRLTAEERVQPCEVYHLKLVIADVGDFAFDSGVFLQAKSLSSNAIDLSNLAGVDPVTGLNYLAEGCAIGSFTISRPKKDPFPLVVNLSYGGTAINGVDVLPLPPSVLIPANDSFVTVNVQPLVDLVPEGIEELKIYALAGCSTGIPADSSMIQIRDYEILSLVPDTAIICNGNSVQLSAGGYTSYQWLPDPTLSSTTVPDPVATPVNVNTTYTCVGTTGSCNAMDSAFVVMKTIDFVSRTDVNCKDGTDGQIRVAGGPEWAAPVEFSLDGVNWQPDSVFNNLAVGPYWVKIRDAGCVDSILVNVAQAYPDLLISNINTLPASCSGDPDGTVTITGAGGNGLYTYSIDGVNFQASNSFNISGGIHTVFIKDGNGCLSSQTATIPLNNTVTLDAGLNNTICEGTTYLMQAVSNADSFAWTPPGSLNDPSILTPSASPVLTTKYYITATTGICTRIDSVIITVRPAPIPDAGQDIDVCYGKIIQLNGSGGVSFQWSPATNFISPTTSQNPDVRAQADIIYSLMVTDVNGCRSLAPDMVSITVTPSVRIFAGNDTIAAIGQPIQLKVTERSTAGVTSYTWTPASLLSNGNIANPVAILTADQRFIVTGTTPDGCQGMDDIVVKVYKGPDIYVPSGFTPNNDGLNDVLRPIPVGIKDFRHFQVFNRWGQLIFSTRDARQGWDGKLKGVDQAGSFVWVAEGTDYKGNLIARKGVVTIIR